jgi:hypothetical protein
MRIAVHLDHSRLLRWHLTLITSLQSHGHLVSSEFRTTSESLPLSVLTILDFDAVRSGSAIDRLSGRITRTSVAECAPESDLAPELRIDVSTSAAIERLSGRVLRPLYDGSVSDETLFHTLLSGHAPMLTVDDTGETNDWLIGFPAIERPTRLGESLDNVASRLVEGLVTVVANIAAGDHPSPLEREQKRKPHGPFLSSAAAFGVRRAATKIERVRDRLLGNRPKWHVAWRRMNGDAPEAGMLEDLRLSDFNVLPDDGKRFYADPFAIHRDDAVHVFVEEMPNDTGIGIISHFSIPKNGEATVPAPVLNIGSHLSYPFVFEQDGETWMMPESSSAGGLDLYRCERFPDLWTLEARLLEGHYHDATLFSHEGRLWIAATTEAFQSSTWDALSLFHAPSLKGPWTPHKRNPVRVDSRNARPAGPLWRNGTNLIRPAQDCGTGYGVGVKFQKITKLTPDEYAEETTGGMAFTGNTGVLGPHTICRAGEFEFVDFFARRCLTPLIDATRQGFAFK